MDQSRKQIASTEIAMANEVFDLFCNATTLKSILGQFRHLCDLLKMRPNTFPQFYPKFKSKLRSWKAQALWKKFDQRANHKCYNRGKACPNTRVLIIGGGPCGLRSAIEAQLLGAKVVVVEKRDRVSRNNVLHLWPFVIQDLRALGAKKFFGKFCAGSIDHISIRQLQCILLKVALILGVEFHENVSFEALVPPPENQEEGKIGWRAKTTPQDHPVSQYEFDVLIGADGKRNTLEGFKRKEFRGKLAIAITANFINKRTEAEARVEEISGVAFIFNQKFFKELYQETGIDLENIVYYKDDTHYFVMTAKKHSLIDKGVILQDHADTAKLLAKENVDRDALMLYAREAAEFSTEYQMMDMEFAVNHYGQPDVAMFDFTSMYAAENASRVLERYGHRLLMTLVGDSLLEPFWPTGSGCARGFLSSMDAGWAIKGWGASALPLEVLAERESIYRLLGQTTPENLNRDYAAYTLDPHTRYPNLNSRSVSAIQVRGLLDTDDPENIKQPSAVPSAIDLPKKRRRRDTQVHPDTLLHWLQRQVALYDDVHIEDMGASFKDGLAISAIIHRYRPDLIDFSSLKSEDTEKNNQLAFDILEKELGISPVMTGEEMAHCDVPDKLAMFSYLSQIYEAFRGEIPHIKHPKLEPENDERPLYTKQLSQLTPEQKAQLIGRLAKPESATRARHSRSRHNNENVLVPPEKKTDTVSRRSRKRRSTEKMGATVEERQKRLEDIEKNRVDRMRKRQYLRKMATQQFYKSIQMLAANAKREKDEPFEDYSIFLYRQTAPDFKDRVKDLEQKILYPDREPKLHAGHHRGSMDEDISGRIKNFEDKFRGTAPNEKKPRDLLRAIGRIEKTDWNVKEIEKKIEENKMGRGMRQDRVEKVPKWSREQFLARQIKMEKKGRDPSQLDSKYAEIDNTLKDIGRKIKEGNVLGQNKVSAMAEQFANKSQDTEPKVQRSNSKAAITLPTQGGSELCHFCDKRVYLMERMSTEGKFFHRGCFRCEYCSTSLRIGNHTFDRDKDGGRFYCTQHFGLPGTIKARVEKKKIPLLNKENILDSSVPKKQVTDKAKTPLEGVAGLDLLDRGQTPERIEFENLAGMSDAEEAQSQMDEDEWTDRNFGASAAEMGSSDDISDMSDSDEENEVYEEAMDQPLTTEGTIELAKNWTLRYSHPHASTGHSDTGSNEYEDSSDEYTSEDEESGTATEDEEDVRARELRKQEVWLKVPPRSSDTDTGSETEVKHSQESTVDENLEAKPSGSDVNGDVVVVVALESSVDADSNSQKTSVPVATKPSETNDLDIENSLSSLDNTLKTDEAFHCRNLEEAQQASYDSSSSLSHLGVGYVDLDSSTLGSNSSNSRKELPDAIPDPTDETRAKETDPNIFTNSLQINGDNLPDLITSSPKLDRQTNKTVVIISERKNRNSVIPAVSVTEATPIAEKISEFQAPSSTKESQDSFEDLKQELKLRRARKREGLAELRPLSRETARSKVSEYFNAMKQPSTSAEPRLKEETKIAADLLTTEEITTVPIIPLGAKSQVSDKVESKDLMKYFERRSSQGCEDLADAAKVRRRSSVGGDRLQGINEQFKETKKHKETRNNEIEAKVEVSTTQEEPEVHKNDLRDGGEELRETGNHKEGFKEANKTHIQSEIKNVSEIHKNDVCDVDEELRGTGNHNEGFKEANEALIRSITKNVLDIDRNDVCDVGEELDNTENHTEEFKEAKKEKMQTNTKNVPENHNDGFKEANEAVIRSITKNVLDIHRNNVCDIGKELDNTENHSEGFTEAKKEKIQSNTKNVPENHSEDFKEAKEEKIQSNTKNVPEIHKNVSNDRLRGSKNDMESLKETKMQPKEKKESKVSEIDEKTYARHRLAEPPPIEKIKVVVKEIAAPTATISVPKRPERKRTTHESTSSDYKETTTPTSNLTPEIPRRRRPDSKTLSKKESDTEIESKVSSDYSLPDRTSKAISSDHLAKESRTKSPPEKLNDELKRNANPLKSLSLGKPDVHGSSKSVASSKFDKANKKDKCIIS